MKQNILKYILIFAVMVFASSCGDPLDKENLTQINPDDVWTSADLAEAYINNMYADFMPGMPMGTGNGTDEGVTHEGQAGTMSPWLRGIATIDSWNNWQYSRIRKVNIFLENIEEATFSQQEKDMLKGQALFWRAWAYFSMVKGYGGVPLILEAQPLDDVDALFLPRNKTSECITQIIKDLDDASALLPNAWAGSDWGRIDKGAAMAMKGRVLLFWASPLFNPSNDSGRWQDAYTANKAALDHLKAQGKGLYETYADIWDVEPNKEGVMIRRFNDPGATYANTSVRPLLYSKDAVGADRPSLQLVNAFPMKDGSAFDINNGYETLWQNRDDRFYATIGYNGADAYLQDMVDLNTKLWTYKHATGWADGPIPSPSSFYRIKGVDKDIVLDEVYQADVDWLEIRFAEVLMNYGEAANETGKQGEALQVLKDIRARAGIDAGTGGNYGISATSKSEIREAYFNERFVEFAFEGKRWDHLRRTRKFDVMNNLPRRTGLKITLKAGEPLPAGDSDINTIYPVFDVEEVITDIENINIPDNYYFYGIPRTHLDRNSKLEQTKGWDGGTFDPLE